MIPPHDDGNHFHPAIQEGRDIDAGFGGWPGSGHVGTVMYLAYGNGPHIAEAVFWLLTAAHFEPFATGRIRYVVYTDRPEAFAALHGVVVVRLDPARLGGWLGGGDYIHRRKPMAILDALTSCKGKLAFVDTDTCFQQSPLRLFDRIGPGRSCLHLLENVLGLSRDASARRILATLSREPFAWADGKPATPPGAGEMWNSGVTGLDHSDIDIIREGLRLSDHLWQRSRAHTCEQFAVGMAARRMTQVSSAWDVVFHYWSDDLKAQFHPRLDALLGRILSLSPDLRAQAAFDQRLTITPAQWARDRAKAAAARLGGPVYRALTSLRPAGRAEGAQLSL